MTRIQSFTGAWHTINAKKIWQLWFVHSFTKHSVSTVSVPVTVPRAETGDAVLKVLTEGGGTVQERAAAPAGAQAGA